MNFRSLCLVLVSMALLFSVHGQGFMTPPGNWGFELGLRNWVDGDTVFPYQPQSGDVVPAGAVIRLPVGGSYWKDLSYPLGQQGKKWFSTGWEGALQANEQATGTLLSEPFLLQAPFVSFLISGGKDEEHLKVEVLAQKRDDFFDDERFYPANYLLAKTNVNVESGNSFSATGHDSELFRREWWNLSALRGFRVRFRITDASEEGHLNLDDFRFHNEAPARENEVKTSKMDKFDGFWRDRDRPVWGWADLHAHPMSDLGFGQKFLHGRPDGDPETALGHCRCSHGSWAPWNACGNLIRNVAINNTESFAAKNTHGIGYVGDPDKNFKDWPKFYSLSHQQMWVEWVRRSYEGGQRLMVALAVNNELLADAIQADEPFDDSQVAALQIDSLKTWVGRHDFMEIAYSPREMRDIIQRGHLAVLIGMEIDHPGGFHYGDELTEDSVRAALLRIHEMGVRYLFPIHIVDNAFGGAAVYEPAFNMANKYANGRQFEVEPAAPDAAIRFELQYEPSFGLSFVRWGNRGFPKEVVPIGKRYEDYTPSATGHENALGLTEVGEFAVQEMMRMGMVLDIDHMSRKAAERTLDLAERVPGGYPLCSGHNGFRGEWGKASENQRTPEQARRIAQLGGMMGVGFALGSGGEGQHFSRIVPDSARQYTNSRVENNCGGSGRSFVQSWLYALELFGGKQVAIGTDANGLVALPAPRFGRYACYQTREEREIHGRQVSAQDSASFVSYWGGNVGESDPLYPCEMGGKTWDLNTDGMAHYGMFPDFWQDLRNVGLSAKDLNPMFRSAEDFILMWERCERTKVRVGK